MILNRYQVRAVGAIPQWLPLGVCLTQSPVVMFRTGLPGVDHLDF